MVHSYFTKQEANQMPALFRLPFNKEEEDSLKKYLHNDVKDATRHYLIIAYYLQRGDCTNAIKYHTSVSQDLTREGMSDLSFLTLQAL